MGTSCSCAWATKNPGDRYRLGTHGTPHAVPPQLPPEFRIQNSEFRMTKKSVLPACYHDMHGLQCSSVSCLLSPVSYSVAQETQLHSAFPHRLVAGLTLAPAR